MGAQGAPPKTPQHLIYNPNFPSFPHTTIVQIMETEKSGYFSESNLIAAILPKYLNKA